MNVFFDLDGTLIDARPRLFHLFQNLVRESNLTFDAYWELKRSKVSHEMILTERFGYNSLQVEIFKTEWMRRIEMPEWLAFDKPFYDVGGYLTALKRHANLYVVTSRQSDLPVLSQMQSFGWDTLFNDVLVTFQKSDKSTLIAKKIKAEPKDWFVGDTGKDIQAGKHLGINTAAVLTGFLNRITLSEYSPDVIVEKVTDLKFNGML